MLTGVVLSLFAFDNHLNSQQHVITLFFATTDDTQFIAADLNQEDLDHFPRLLAATTR